MNFRQIATKLDKSAAKFVDSGELQKAFAAMEIAAYIRRKPEKFQKIKFEYIGEN